MLSLCCHAVDGRPTFWVSNQVTFVCRVHCPFSRFSVIFYLHQLFTCINLTYKYLIRNLKCCVSFRIRDLIQLFHRFEVFSTTVHDRCPSIFFQLISWEERWKESTILGSVFHLLTKLLLMSSSSVSASVTFVPLYFVLLKVCCYFAFRFMILLNQFITWSILNSYDYIIICVFLQIQLSNWN